MRLRKHERDHKRQRGQYMTPASLAADVISGIDLVDCSRILEPSCGDGVFLDAIMSRVGRCDETRPSVELVGIDVDATMVEHSRAVVSRRAKDGNAVRTSVYEGDFFRCYLSGLLPCTTGGDVACRRRTLLQETFDLIVGNPPFGGTFDPEIEDALDARLGRRLGIKVKKETYAFFIVACVDLLRPGGQLVFICSDSLLTIPTMKGLRHFLMHSGTVRVTSLKEFSAETAYPMFVLQVTKGRATREVAHNSLRLDPIAIERTPNLSWGITPELARLFHGPLLGECFVASSGMTTGKNELFVREVDAQQSLMEHLRFEVFDAPVSVAYERQRARLGRLPEGRRRKLEEAERLGETERRLRIERRKQPILVQVPDDRYRPYNKANNRIVYSPPTHYIYWENDGEAVLTYKKTGNWYLRGVGGQPYFGREGLTWQLVASRFVARYLPPGYILDSGAPCAFLREGVSREELFFVLAWLLSPLAKRTLKEVINHTRNIQSKDFERMPYPWWVGPDLRSEVICTVQGMVSEAESGKRWSWRDREVCRLGSLFEFPSEGVAVGTENERACGDHVSTATNDLFS